MAVGTMKGGYFLELNYLNPNPNSKANVFFLDFIVEEKNWKRGKA